MDYYLPNDHAAAAALRREFKEYLTRHAMPGSDIAGAELAFSELVTNAVEHSDGDVWVSVDWGARRPVVTVHDLGEGFEPPDDATPAPSDSSGRGLLVAAHLTRELSIAAKRQSGTRVTATLEVERAESSSHDPPASVVGQLPDMFEARNGFFGRESFLRALVVEMAQTVELDSGPVATERAVAQVGTDVGGRMEDAYRNERGLDGQLDIDDLGELYVGLKQAIGGDFYVIEADEQRIVLGNRRCPFGEAVRHAPSLCRMTSSVFGGIAARNTGRDVAVQLEERIAVGDPECRVTVWLEPPPVEVEAYVHHYRARPSGRS